MQQVRSKKTTKLKILRTIMRQSRRMSVSDEKTTGNVEEIEET